MSQHDYVIADAAGAAFLADLNLALPALASLNSGATAPATTYAYMLWADTTSGWLKQRDAANAAWILRAPLGTGAAVDVASAATLDLTANTATSATLRITGTTTTTAITLADGQQRLLRAAAAWPITHGASLICPGSASYTCAAGDLVLAIGEAASVVRLMIWKADGTPVVGSGMTLGTKQVGTGTASNTFTSLPTGIKRLSLNFSLFSTNGTSIPIIQIGDSGGYKTTGYAGAIETASSRYTFSDGFKVAGVGDASWSFHGRLELELLDAATYLWSALITAADDAGGANYSGAGSVTLSGTLDRLKITTQGGTDTIDVGSIFNISYIR